MVVEDGQFLRVYLADGPLNDYSKRIRLALFQEEEFSLGSKCMPEIHKKEKGRMWVRLERRM